MHLWPGLIIFFLAINGLCSHPLSDQENEYVPVRTDVPPECPLGFKLDEVNNKCQLVWITAGNSTGNENLQVLCPNGLTFDETTKLCKVGDQGIVHVIGAPIVCHADMRKDRKGNCREIFVR